jgi:hypothetical protein
MGLAMEIESKGKILEECAGIVKLFRNNGYYIFLRNKSSIKTVADVVIVLQTGAILSEKGITVYPNGFVELKTWMKNINRVLGPKFIEETKEFVSNKSVECVIKVKYHFVLPRYDKGSV